MMGKIMVIGKAEQEYDADICNINIEIGSVRKKASEASQVSSEHCEALLSKLQELGIEPNSVEIQYDHIVEKSDYRSNETSYESKKSLWLHLPADMKMINAVRSIIECGFEDVSFATIYSVSNEIDLNRELLKKAISDSRSRAELLASSMDLQITGVDSANLSGDRNVYDLAKDDDDEEEEAYQCNYLRAPSSRYPLSDKLKPDKVELRAEVRIVWLIG